MSEGFFFFIHMSFSSKALISDKRFPDKCYNNALISPNIVSKII